MTLYSTTQAKPRGPQKPIPRYHHDSPTLLRVASAWRKRAESAERTRDDLLEQHSLQTQALAAAQQLVADLQRQLTELRKVTWTSVVPLLPAAGENESRRIDRSLIGHPLDEGFEQRGGASDGAYFDYARCIAEDTWLVVREYADGYVVQIVRQTPG